MHFKVADFRTCSRRGLMKEQTGRCNLRSSLDSFVVCCGLPTGSCNRFGLKRHRGRDLYGGNLYRLVRAAFFVLVGEVLVAACFVWVSGVMVELFEIAAAN